MKWTPTKSYEDWFQFSFQANNFKCFARNQIVCDILLIAIEVYYQIVFENLVMQVAPTGENT